jgi:hypothetical protein
MAVASTISESDAQHIVGTPTILSQTVMAGPAARPSLNGTFFRAVLHSSPPRLRTRNASQRASAESAAAQTSSVPSMGLVSSRFSQRVTSGGRR